MVSFIVFVIGIFIVILGVFLSLIVSLIQFLLNLIIANILPIGLILFGLSVLFVVLAIYLPEQKQQESETEKKENNSQHSTAQVYTRENTVSDNDKSNKATIDVKSTVVKEQPKSYKSHQNKEPYRASTKHYTKEKSSYNQYSLDTKEKNSTKNGSTQAIVSPNYRANTESDFRTERSTIYYSGFSEVRPELRRLKLSPSQSTIKSGETIQFKLTGLDKFNNEIEISDRISWTATAGEIDSTGLFSIYCINNVLVRVTAKVGTLETTATVNVESIYEIVETPQLKSLEVVPDCISLQPNEEQIFKAIGLDRYNNPIDCGEIIWSATGGTIDQNGKLLVDNNSKGIYQVTATSKHTPKHNAVTKTTLLTLGVSTRILSWAIANEEFFYDILAPLLNLTNDDSSLSETDALVQGWILEIGRRRVAKLLKKASNLSFKEAFSNVSDSIDYIVVPELRKIEFINPPSNVKPGDRIQFNVIGLDQARDRINVDNQIVWTATSGLIDSQGIFIANGDTDSVEITAKVIDKNIETRIKIKVESTFEAEYVELGEIRASNKLSDLGTAIVSKITQRTTDNKFGFVEEQSSKDSVYIQETQNLSHARNFSDISPSKTNKEDSCSSIGKQSRETPFINKAFAAESQSNSPGFASLNTNSVYGNNNLASKNSFKLPDNLPAPEAPLYSTNNYISLSEPSWFYRSQVFHDGFFEGDFSYNTYLEYMSTKDYYSYSK